MRGEADGCAFSGEEAASRELIDDVESTRNSLVAELGLDCGDRDAGIQAEAEEPGFFVLTIGREPGGFWRMRAVKVSSEIVGGGEAKDLAGLVCMGGGGFAQHGGGVESEAEVGAALPVAEIMEGPVAWAGEVGDFVLSEAGGGEGFNGVLVHARDGVVSGNNVGVVASAAGEEFAAETGFVVDFKHVDTGVGDAGGDEGGN